MMPGISGITSCTSPFTCSTTCGGRRWRRGRDTRGHSYFRDGTAIGRPTCRMALVSCDANLCVLERNSLAPWSSESSCSTPPSTASVSSDGLFTIVARIGRYTSLSTWRSQNRTLPYAECRSKRTRSITALGEDMPSPKADFQSPMTWRKDDALADGMAVGRKGIGVAVGRKGIGSTWSRMTSDEALAMPVSRCVTCVQTCAQTCA